MKKLSDVSFRDAKAILKAGYPEHFRTVNHLTVNGWKIKDVSKDMGEPCKCMQEKYRRFEFYFFDSDICLWINNELEINDSDIYVCVNNESEISDWNKTKDICINKAKELGYEI